MSCVGTSVVGTGTKRKRKDLTLSDKLEIIQLASEKTMSQTKLSQQFGCSQSTISKVLHHEEEIRQDAADNKLKGRKRRRTGKSEKVEKALHTWFTDARARGAPVTTIVLEEKAKQLATTLNEPDFTVTNGWLCRWKARHGIKYKKAHGEKSDADLQSAETWSSTVLCEVLENYEAQNIYNADETGIYYRALPDGTLTFASDKLSGSKKAKDRITALVAVNMDGSDKRPLLIIGKSKNPRCFRDIQHLPTPYKNNTNAWMTGVLFRDWLVDFEREMAKENRSIALIVDNCSAHPKDSADDLPHINLIFLPPNVTSVIQPCDMGIIRNLKANYRRNLVSRIIMHIDASSNVTVSSLVKSISLLDAMHMLKVAWQDVKQSTIVNCFAKAGFITRSPDDDQTESPPIGLTAEEFNAFIDIDSSLECHGSLTDEEICASVQDTCESLDLAADSDDECSTSEDTRQAPNLKDATLSLYTLRAFMEQHAADLSIFYMLENQMQKVVTNKAKQTSIKDYFTTAV